MDFTNNSLTADILKGNFFFNEQQAYRIYYYYSTRHLYRTKNCKFHTWLEWKTGQLKRDWLRLELSRRLAILNYVWEI